MLDVRRGEPTISQVYDAFDEASHRVFRRAMERSRGGVVRVADLLAALAELFPALVAQAFPSGWRPSPPPPGPDSLPMANEPALRELLRLAFELAHAERPPRPHPLTPAVLAAAACMRRSALPAARPEEACPHAVPISAQGHRRLEPSCAAIRRAEPERTPSREDLVLAILELWLAARNLPAGQEYEQQTARIARLVQRL